MSSATLGELFGAASDQLSVAARAPESGMDTASAAAATEQAGLVGTALSRLLDTVISGEQTEIVLTWDADSLTHAAVHSREALATAISGLRVASSGLGPATSYTGPAVALSSAVQSLRAGHDLLRTHIATSPDGIQSATSHWARVLHSEDFAGALLDQVGRQASQLGACLLALSSATSANPEIPAWVREQLATAHRWLNLASDAAGAARRTSPVTAAGRLLIYALPPNAYPDRKPLSGHEPLGVLCEGIAISSIRLRAAVPWPAEQAAWMPQVTADSWRWTATATAVAADLTDVILHSLAARAGESSVLPRVVARPLSVAAAAAAAACTRWRLAALEWSDLTTDTTGMTGLGVADTSDLVIRLGRLAFADPHWAPARSRRASVRDPAELVPDLDHARAVLSAVHDAADALLAMARVDLRSVSAAAFAGRIHEPVRSPTEGTRYGDGHAARRFTRVAPGATLPLQEAYQAAIDASAGLAGALDVLAVAIDAPTGVLAAARAVGPARQHERAPRTALAESAATPADRAALLGRKLESVEQGVRDLGVNDPMMLLRAQAVDRARRQILAQAAGMSADAAERPVARPRDTSPARMANKDFPQRAVVPQPGSSPVASRSDQSSGTTPAAGESRQPRKLR